jgi:hypothetical protein
MRGEADQDMTDMNQFGLGRDEARALRADLDVEEWAALLDVQRSFASAPLLSPSAGFVDRVRQSLAARERQRARRRSILGITCFILGSILITAQYLWLSPFAALSQARGWTDLLNMFASSVSILAVILEIAGAFAQTMLGLLGEWLVLSLSLFALALTILWTRVVVGWTPLNRQEPI